MKPVILISGGIVTRGLTEHLHKDFDIAVFDPQIAESQHQKYGDKILMPLRMSQEQSVANQNMAMSHATAMVLSSFAKEPPPKIAERVSKDWAFPKGGLVDSLTAWLPGYLHSSLTRQIARQNALDSMNRDVVLCVTHEDVTEVFGGMTRWAKARGIPTLHIPHGNSFMLKEHGPDLHDTSICDYMAATPHMAEYFRERGYQGEIRVTGSPLFDRWLTYPKDREWARKVLRLDDRKCIVYSTSWGQLTNGNDRPELLEPCYFAMLDSMQPDWQLIVSMPGGMPEGAEQWHAQKAHERGVKCLVTRLYLELILSAADYVVKAGASNLMVDAAMLDVPGVTLNLPGYRINHPAIKEIEFDGIKEAVADRTAFDENKVDFIAEHGSDGKATERIAKWCREIVK